MASLRLALPWLLAAAAPSLAMAAPPVAAKPVPVAPPPVAPAAEPAPAAPAMPAGLDLRPRAGSDAVPLPPPVTAGDLPFVPAPLASERDHRDDVEVEIAVLGGVPLRGVAPLAGMQVDLGLVGDGGRRSFGLCFRGGRLIGDFAPEDDDGGGLLAAFGLRFGLRPLRAWPALELGVDGGGGVAQRDGGVSALRAVFAAAIRYAPAPSGPLGFAVALRPLVLLGGRGPEAMIGLSLGVVLRPGRQE